jgi:hypothetical protein
MPETKTKAEMKRCNHDWREFAYCSVQCNKCGALGTRYARNGKDCYRMDKQQNPVGTTYMQEN